MDALAVALGKKVNFVLEADIQTFFDTIEHGWLQKFIEHRSGDKRVVRLLGKWLRAGVMEGETWRETEAGTPQGGINSPLLANEYLHYALDLWAHKWRKTEAGGEEYIVRYADDVVMGFERQEEAEAMRRELAKRLEQCGLKLHPDKTRVLRFGRYARKDCKREGLSKPKTFDFLGLTHISGENAKSGWYQLRRQTARNKKQAKRVSLREEMRRRRHEPLKQQQRWLRAVLRGHYQYYGVPLNYAQLAAFRREVERSWLRSLERRGQRRRFTEVDKQRLRKRFPLPPPRIYHLWPNQRRVVR